MSPTLRTLLSSFSTKSARKGTTALRSAGFSEFDRELIRLLVRAGKIRRTTSGWYLRVEVS